MKPGAFLEERIMQYLVLAVLCSAIISLTLRFADKYVKDDIAMFIANYFVCTALSFAYMKGANPFLITEGSSFAIGLGVLGGAFFLLSLALLQINIKKNGVVLAATFMKLGVLVPTLMAVVVFHDAPKVMQIIGFVVAIIAIIVINGISDDDNKDRRASWLLIVLLLSGGFTDSLANIYDKVGNPQAKDQYLFFIFLVAMILCLIILVVKKRVPTLAELAIGAFVGIPNYYSTRFLLLALGKLPAILVYPAFNIATILIISIVGTLVFKESLTKQKATGIALIAVALVLLNI